MYRNAVTECVHTSLFTAFHLLGQWTWWNKQSRQGWWSFVKAEKLMGCTFGHVYIWVQYLPTWLYKIHPFPAYWKAVLPLELEMQTESSDEVLELFISSPSIESNAGCLVKLIETRSIALKKHSPCICCGTNFKFVVIRRYFFLDDLNLVRHAYGKVWGHLSHLTPFEGVRSIFLTLFLIFSFRLSFLVKYI